jgi:mono/diheme cytochrome c family protein
LQELGVPAVTIPSLRIFAGLAALIVWGSPAGAQDAKPALYTAAQAQAGGIVFVQNCATCHGSALEGGMGPALKGVAFGERAVAQSLTAQSLLDVAAYTMPQSNPGSLKPEDYNAVVAYVLQQNGYPAGATALAPNAPGMKETRITP